RPSPGRLAGKVVCVTGELMRYKRKEVEALIVTLGGEVSAGVTKGVNLVVAGEAAGSKLEKAKALGIEVIDEAAFATMIGK
ncbi:MAG: BRCT domain-containing protein, partial [Gemmataceae bacterium]